MGIYEEIQVLYGLCYTNIYCNYSSDNILIMYISGDFFVVVSIVLML